jgi:hypothetical protein
MACSFHISAKKVVTGLILQVLTAATTWTAVFVDVALCTLMEIYVLQESVLPKSSEYMTVLNLFPQGSSSKTNNLLH